MLRLNDALDMINLKEKGTQHTKSVKLKESTYNVLLDMKINDPKMKSIDDVIVNTIATLALMTYKNS